LNARDATVPTTPRTLPYVLLGAFAVLVVGGIVLSLSSAPPLAEAQLHIAARATMNASGFALTDVNSVRPLNAVSTGTGARRGSATEVFHVLYQAPDSVQESEAGPNGQITSIILIGPRRFRGSGSQWTELPAGPGLVGQAVETIKSPLRAASSATRVTRRGNLYRFVPVKLDQFLATVLGVPQPELSSPRLTAVVRGDYIAHEQITAVVGRQHLEVDLDFFAVGSAPPVTAPPASSLAPAPSATSP